MHSACFGMKLGVEEFDFTMAQGEQAFHVASAQSRRADSGTGARRRQAGDRSGANSDPTSHDRRVDDMVKALLMALRDISR